MANDEAERADNRGTSEDEPLGPATPDDETALGDTPEAHDELSPHDLPKHHPGRQAAEELAARRGADTTRGHEEGGAEDDGDTV